MATQPEAMHTGSPRRTGLHTGAEYFRHITQVASDLEARAAFQRRVLEIAPPGALLFDFGAGPGIDARFFAERGYSVRAYDVDPAMCDFFDDHCRDLIDQGRVVLERGSYREFLDRADPPAARAADLVIANFAPLNLVPDVRELFAKFAALTAPSGKVLASVLNPFYLSEMRHPWWWRVTPRLVRDGYFFMPGPQAPHTRRLASEFGRLSAPAFRLVGVFRGVPWADRAAGGVTPSASPEAGRAPRSDPWYRIVRGRFVFLLFEKRATRMDPMGTYSLS